MNSNQHSSQFIYSPILNVKSSANSKRKRIHHSTFVPIQNRRQVCPRELEACFKLPDPVEYSKSRCLIARKCEPVNIRIARTIAKLHCGSKDEKVTSPLSHFSRFKQKLIRENPTPNNRGGFSNYLQKLSGNKDAVRETPSRDCFDNQQQLQSGHMSSTSSD